ncbi:hypothetical protein PT2222_150002 [Paraburkholderia tropica]
MRDRSDAWRIAHRGKSIAHTGEKEPALRGRKKTSKLLRGGVTASVYRRCQATTRKHCKQSRHPDAMRKVPKCRG